MHSREIELVESIRQVDHKMWETEDEVQLELLRLERVRLMEDLTALRLSFIRERIEVG